MQGELERSEYNGEQEPLCPLCKRPLGTVKISKHHLTPKSRGGKHTQTVYMHNICHQKIHSVYSEKELKLKFNTVEKLLQSEELKKFVKWVSRKPPEFYERNRLTSKRKADRSRRGRDRR